jgi:hypothetical protein
MGNVAWASPYDDEPVKGITPLTNTSSAAKDAYSGIPGIDDLPGGPQSVEPDLLPPPPVAGDETVAAPEPQANPGTRAMSQNLARLNTYLRDGDWTRAEAAIAYIQKELDKEPSLKPEFQKKLEQARETLTPTTNRGAIEKNLLRLSFYNDQRDYEKATLAIVHIRKQCTADPSAGASFEGRLQALTNSTALSIINEIRVGLNTLDQRVARGNDPALIGSTIKWTRSWVELLKRIGGDETRNIVANATNQLDKVERQYRLTAVTSVMVPYLCQYDNAIEGPYTCQNTSHAMVLRAYGWKGTPDDITRVFGRKKAQSPEGGADVFNYFAEQAGLKVRARGYNAPVSQFTEALKKGRPLVVHGYFTGDGHVVVVNGFDGTHYDVNDPAGRWNLGVHGSYNSYVSGAHLKYPDWAFHNAVIEGGTVWYVEFEPVP